MFKTRIFMSFNTIQATNHELHQNLVGKHFSSIINLKINFTCWNVIFAEKQWTITSRITQEVNNKAVAVSSKNWWVCQQMRLV